MFAHILEKSKSTNNVIYGTEVTTSFCHGTCQRSRKLVVPSRGDTVDRMLPSAPSRHPCLCISLHSGCLPHDRIGQILHPLPSPSSRLAWCEVRENKGVCQIWLGLGLINCKALYKDHTIYWLCSLTAVAQLNPSRVAGGHTILQCTLINGASATISQDWYRLRRRLGRWTYVREISRPTIKWLPFLVTYILSFACRRSKSDYAR